MQYSWSYPLIDIITPPLAIHFVWHHADNESFKKYCQPFRRFLTRDIERPFSRELNIPTFFYSSLSEIPSYPISLAQRNIVFICMSENTLTDERWIDFYKNFPVDQSLSLIPVAFDINGLKHCNHQGALLKRNALRLYEFGLADDDQTRELESILKLLHELYRFGFVDTESPSVGSDTSIHLFLSHAKKGEMGEIYAKAIKHYIDTTNMKNFFDASEISVGYQFDTEIISHIHKSTLIAITTDAYSSRYWCQREILEAKKNNRPIISVNCLQVYEDRIFPPAANVPCVHIAPTDQPTKFEILNILVAALTETIRFNFSISLLEYYKQQLWIDSTAIALARPPEIQQIVSLRSTLNESEILKICYPEPPIYAEEIDWLEFLKVKPSTPLWAVGDSNTQNKKIGISISEYGEDFENIHIHEDELKRFSQELVRHLLVRGNTIIFGGDLRKDGFTEFLLDEASILQNRLPEREFKVENHLAWPLHITNDLSKWKIKYDQIISQIKYGIPDDIDGQVDESVFLPPTDSFSKFIWSRSLTFMREQSISNSDIRVFAGGRPKGYKGKMPGVLEELLISIEYNKPIYLVGGLGGIIKDICMIISGDTIPETLTLDWQLSNNEGYDELIDYLSQQGYEINYFDFIAKIKSIDIDHLASLAGLSVVDYRKLMKTPFIDEVIHLILKGVKKIA
ncbi:hypothetical protein HMPREF0016_01123 [Acinetobacter johnsonii SH046]|jgi:hypothetical protein|uniref:TIR domain-containing protein n=1 Tax=Acinetobacter johnsonii SH046 TaxID=575586 RepID=D0SBA0_ACIJO|nr:hypothetical protein HMPREF0016_01123 [Acinetobacter johnsonii SH046]NWK49218.1 TIR domain-containing protein [Acinetobacter sp. SwsAc7]